MAVSRACDITFTSAEIFLIHEVQDRNTRPQIGTSLKLLGYIENFHPISCGARLFLDSSSIEVGHNWIATSFPLLFSLFVYTCQIDTRFIGGTIFEEDHLYNIIGELERSASDPGTVLCCDVCTDEI